ncbi:hypothetical protein PG994_002572 [Apiospora phragmitis]|uniref:Uncharacterized protein n=1 Tax=Apiospora phragmitis TaxID=2905665 RepID=A0ABR1W5L2_9PEZI
MIALIFWIWTALVSTLVSGAAVLPDDSSASRSSASASGIMWRGNITVDGPVYQFNGTVQEIYAQIMKANPEYKLMEVPRKDPAAPLKASVTSIACETPNGPPDDWGYALGDEIYDGIKYLRGLTGDCGVTPGPCGRISCSWDSAISWCWDSPTGGYATKCSALADYAQAAADQCPYRSNEVWGTAYAAAGFSVQVAGKLHLC